MHAQPQFDPYAFAGRRTKAVSAESCLSYQDFGSMHIQRRKAKHERRLPTPKWSATDAGIRDKVLHILERRFYLAEPVGLTDRERLERINEAARKRLPIAKSILQVATKRYHEMSLAGGSPELMRRLAIEVQNRDTDLVLLKRGIAAVMISAVYKYYRLGWGSTQVANDLGIKPPMLRVWLYRMNGGVCKRYATAKTSWPEAKMKALLMMRASGLRWDQCLKAMNVTTAGSLKRQWRLAFGDLQVGPPPEKTGPKPRTPGFWKKTKRVSERSLPKVWGEASVEELIRLHSKHSVEQICELTGRSRHSVQYGIAKFIHKTR